MKFIKRNKFTIIIILAFVSVIVMAALVRNVFFINTGQPAYGNRLDGIDEVKIEKSRYKEISDKIKKNDKVENMSINLSGKTINVIMTVKNNVSKKDAKSVSDTILKEFSKEELAFYDVQVYVKKKDEKQNDFPIIGYKHHLNSGFSWSKDRAVDKSEK